MATDMEAPQSHWVKLELDSERKDAMFQGISEALSWAEKRGQMFTEADQVARRYHARVKELEEEKAELNQRLIKLAEDNMTLVQGSNAMMDDHKKVVANLLIEVETVKSNAAAQAEALTAEVEHYKALFDSTQKKNKR